MNEEDEEFEKRVQEYEKHMQTEGYQPSQYESSPSASWYLVPILFGLLGGIIMYAALRNEDEDMALRGLFLGVGITALCVLVTLWIGWIKL
jgi:hypothetical protein